MVINMFKKIKTKNQSMFLNWLKCHSLKLSMYLIDSLSTVLMIK